MSVRAIPESHSDILKRKAFAHVATLGPDGSPQSNPVWFEWDGEFFLFSQTKTRQKYHNVQRNPRVAISILDPDNPYRYLELRGVVERISDDDENAFINALAKKYLDQDVYPWHQPGDERVVVAVGRRTPPRWSERRSVTPFGPAGGTVQPSPVRRASSSNTTSRGG